MKLRNIYVLCRNNIHAIESLMAENVSVNGRSASNVKGWEKCRKAIEELISVPALKEECEEILDNVPAIFITKDTFTLSNEEWRNLDDNRYNLRRTMIDIMDLYQKMGVETEEKIGLDIKLPKYSDFGEFVKYINDIDFIFSKCPFLRSDDERLEFENVDVGSTWLTFFVIGATITGESILLNNIAAFIDKCIIIRSHYLSCEKQKHDLEVEKQNEDEKAIILKYIDNLYKKEVACAIKDLEEITNYKVENRDGDEIGRIEQCMGKLGGLIDEGLQICSTIDSPKEVKALFEPIEMKYLAVSEKLKLLEEKENE